MKLFILTAILTLNTVVGFLAIAYNSRVHTEAKFAFESEALKKFGVFLIYAAIAIPSALYLIKF